MPQNAKTSQPIDRSSDYSSAPMDPKLFFPGIALAGAVCIMMTLFPEQASVGVKASYNFVMKNFSFVFMIGCIAALAFCLWLAFGRFGHVRLGGPDEKPEFSTFSWICMLFVSSCGVGLMIWSIVEPIYYIEGPPMGIEPMSDQAFHWAHMLPQFHWGFSAWAFYCVATVPVAYAVYVRREGVFRICDTCRPILKHHADGFWGRCIEFFVLLGTIGATGTTMGLAIPLMATLISSAFNLDNTMTLKGVICFFLFCTFGLSAYLGLHRGIQNLTRINVLTIFLILGWVLFLGPFNFIMDIWSNSLGLLAQNFGALSFQTAPYRLVAGGSDAWPQWWTVFYWAWWIAYAPVTALFLSRISRGRTIRELVIAELIWGTLGCWLFLSIFGAYSLYLQKSGLVDVSGIRQALGDPAACLAVMSALPLKAFIVPLYTANCLLFAATVLDSAAFAMANICTKKGYGHSQPARWNRLVWAGVIGVFGMGILITGGESALRTVQTSTIVGGIILVPIIFIMALSLWKSLHEDFGNLLDPQHVINPKLLVQDGKTAEAISQS